MWELKPTTFEKSTMSKENIISKIDLLLSHVFGEGEEKDACMSIIKDDTKTSEDLLKLFETWK